MITQKIRQEIVENVAWRNQKTRYGIGRQAIFGHRMAKDKATLGHENVESAWRPLNSNLLVGTCIYVNRKATICSIAFLNLGFPLIISNASRLSHGKSLKK